MCTVASSCLYRTTHYWNRSDYRCISPRPHTYVLWCQCQVKFRLGVTAFNNAGPNPLKVKLFRRYQATMSGQSTCSSVQNQIVEKKPNQSCQSVILLVYGWYLQKKILLRYGDTVDDLFNLCWLFQLNCSSSDVTRWGMFATRRSRPTILSKRTSLPMCTTVYNRCTPRPVSGHPHTALSRRGRQRV